MARQHHYYIGPRQELHASQDLQEIIQALVQTNSQEEVKKILFDILSNKELDSLKHRWQAVKLVAQGVSYREIAEKLDISTSTVTRAASSLHEENGGWQILLKRCRL